MDKKSIVPLKQALDIQDIAVYVWLSIEFDCSIAQAKWLKNEIEDGHFVLKYDVIRKPRRRKRIRNKSNHDSKGKNFEEKGKSIYGF